MNAETKYIITIEGANGLHDYVSDINYQTKSFLYTGDISEAKMFSSFLAAQYWMIEKTFYAGQSKQGMFNGTARVEAVVLEYLDPEYTILSNPLYLDR